MIHPAAAMLLPRALWSRPLRKIAAAVVMAALLCGVLCPALRASELQAVSPVTDRILMLTFVDGKATHETLGGGGSNGHVELFPLNLTKAASPDSYRIGSKEDARYAPPKAPARVGRKTKGADFVRNRDRFEHVPVHTIYLVLPHPMAAGKTYTVSVGDLVHSGSKSLSLAFNPRKTRSETVHVNQIGYVPTAPQKFGYLSHWMGDLGPLALEPYANAAFHLVEVKTGRSVFSGKPTLRKRLTEPDGGQPDDGPNNNYTGADVWQCDFSAFRTPGRYVLAVEGIGCSFPFRIGDDVYRNAFVTTARALYHQRCGIELKKPYTKWTRPACHRPETRAFRQTTHRYLDGALGDGPKGQKVELTGEKREIWGGWHDAGDWDREDWHVGVSHQLLLVYELAPRNFRDGELNIPESGNGIPDIIDEARWNVDFYKRLQRPDGGVSVGTFASSYPKGGENSTTDTLEWFVYAQDPAASYRYAAVACRLAWCLKMAGKAELAGPYIASARKAWEWAGKNTRPGDEAKVRDERLHAAAALYRATGGETAFHDAFRRDLLIDKPDTPLSVWSKHDQQWGVWTYVTTPDNSPGMDKDLKARLTQATLRFAETNNVETAEKRAGRYGYNWHVPMWWGSASTPNTLPLIVAHHLSRDAKYLAAQYTTCDYMLGGNPLNMVWVTGLGQRHPREVFHIDSWYDNIADPVAGIVPFGPYRYTSEKEATGPWSPGFAQQTAYPDARQWPPHELWFENRLCPPTNEFTVGSIATAAAAYGYLCAPQR